MQHSRLFIITAVVAFVLCVLPLPVRSLEGLQAEKEGIGPEVGLNTDLGIEEQDIYLCQGLVALETGGRGVPFMVVQELDSDCNSPRTYLYPLAILLNALISFAAVGISALAIHKLRRKGRK